MASDADRYRLSESRHQSIFEKKIIPDVFNGHAPASAGSRPIAIIFGGQPGSGKSAAIDHAINENKAHGRFVQIIGDDLRSYHPKYGHLMRNDDKTAAFYTDRDSGRWIEKTIEYAKNQKYNLAIEGTMRDFSKVEATMTSLRGAGYFIDARALAVNERLSWQGVLQRYENQKVDRGYARMTTPEAHSAAYAALPTSIEKIESQKLADRITLYKRGGIILYRNELANGEWQAPSNARQVVENERGRSFTVSELRDYSNEYEKLAVLLAKPERNATQKEVQTLDALRRNASSELKVMESKISRGRNLDRELDFSP